MLGLDRQQLAAIFVGGGAGALARTGLSQAFPSRADHWPWAVFLINLAGAFILGYVVTHVQWRGAHRLARPLLGPGFCGGFTTFSTLQLELLHMLDAHHWALAVGYGAASIVLGLAAVEAGARSVRRRRPLTGIPEPTPS